MKMLYLWVRWIYDRDPTLNRYSKTTWKRIDPICNGASTFDEI